MVKQEMETVGIRCAVSSFLAMVGVLFIHANAVGTLESPAAWNVFVQEWLTRQGTAWAVPFFFVASGYWAHKRIAEGCYGGGHVALRGRKVRGLLVPYLSWAVIGAAIALPLICFNNFYNGTGLFERTFLGAPTVWGKVDALFGITENGPQGNLALWYVRSLLLLFVLAPLWWALGKLGTRWAWLVIGSVLAIGFPNVGVPGLSLRLGSIGWFLLGLAVAAFGIERRRFAWWAVAVCGVLWQGLTGLASAESAGWVELPTWAAWIHAWIAVFGILFVWGVVGRLPISGELPAWMRKTFWVYCLHGSVIAYFTSGGFFVLGKGDGVSVLLMLAAPFLTLTVCVVAGILAERWFPRLYATLSGGRA